MDSWVICLLRGLTTIREHAIHFPGAGRLRMFLSLLTPEASMLRRAAVLLAVLSTVAIAQAAPKAVLVTGASSGIGRKITERLAANGFFVYAGARSQPDLDALNAI